MSMKKIIKFNGSASSFIGKVIKLILKKIEPKGLLTIRDLYDLM